MTTCGRYRPLIKKMAVKRASLKGRVNVRNTLRLTTIVKPRFYCNTEYDGIVDSLRFLIPSEHFLKPYADERIVAILLTKSF